METNTILSDITKYLESYLIEHGIHEYTRDKTGFDTILFRYKYKDNSIYLNIFLDTYDILMGVYPDKKLEIAYSEVYTNIKSALQDFEERILS